jgi:hypothetical protein
MLNKKILKLLLEDDNKSESECSTSSETFFKVGENYLIRTVTMIYTGKIKRINDTQLLLEDAAWIPETETWVDCVKECIFKAVEPYYRDVILQLGAVLDSTIIDTLPREQK